MSNKTCQTPFPNPAWSFGDDFLGECSGHGQCIEGTCVCDEGWTGLSDWINSDGYDCQINILAFQLLWAVLLLIQVVAILVSIPYLKARYESYMQIKNSKQAKGEKYSLWENRGALGMVLWYGVGAPAIIIMSIIKIFKTDERIGVTVLISICYAVVRIVFYLCYVLFQPSLLEAVMKGSKKTTPIIDWNRRISYVFFGMQFVAAFFPFISIADPSAQQPIYLVSSFLMFLTGMWTSLQAYYVTKKLSKKLDESYKVSQQEKTLVMKKKLQDMQSVPIRQAPIVGFLHFIMFIWPFLWNKHDYVLAVSWIIFVRTGLNTARTSISSEENKSINSSSMSSSAASPTNSGNLSPGMSSELATSFAKQKTGFVVDSIVDTDDSVV